MRNRRRLALLAVKRLLEAVVAPTVLNLNFSKGVVDMADEQPPKKKSKLKWFILLFLLLLIAGGSAAAWFLFLKDKFADIISGTDSSPQQQTEKVAVNKAKPLSNTVSLPVFTVNLADPLGQRFIKINLDLEVADAKVTDEIAQQNARIRDTILLLLSSKSYADLATTESKLLLKSEITDRLNSILGPGKIHQVFITDMMIQ